ncbi:MAG TPA: biopolymer transporter ExbD [Terracidiphilus sp.]|nr:biopolymer transporter ExbD [Terracidiphilus sp.]
MATSMDGSGRGSGGQVAQINVTPMIDILLVLLILFMVIVPVVPRGLPALLPRPPKPGVQSGGEHAVVIRVIDHPGASPSYRIDGADVAHAAMLARLEEIYSNRADRVLFIEGDDQVRFADVADLIDMGRAVNVDRIGLLTPGDRLVE